MKHERLLHDQHRPAHVSWAQAWMGSDVAVDEYHLQVRYLRNMAVELGYIPPFKTFRSEQMITLWYFNVDDARMSVELDIEVFRPTHIRDFLECGVWINDKTWIPPHRILSVEVMK